MFIEKHSFKETTIFQIPLVLLIIINMYIIPLKFKIVSTTLKITITTSKSSGFPGTITQKTTKKLTYIFNLKRYYSFPLNPPSLFLRNIRYFIENRCYSYYGTNGGHLHQQNWMKSNKVLDRGIVRTNFRGKLKSSTPDSVSGSLNPHTA